MIKGGLGNIQVSFTPPWGALPSRSKVSTSPSPAWFFQNLCSDLNEINKQDLIIGSGHGGAQCGALVAK